MVQHAPFFGRQSEFNVLLAVYEATVAKNAEGEFTGPRAIAFVGESGYGATRVVQQLYYTLSRDARWNGNGYWPPVFGSNEVSVAPAMGDTAPQSLPQFLWIAARSTEHAGERVPGESALPSIEQQLHLHRQICTANTNVLQDARRHLQEKVRKDGVSDVIIEGLGGLFALTGLPPIPKIADALVGAVQFLMRRAKAPKTADAAARTYASEQGKQLLNGMKELTRNGAIPLVFWLDRSHWVDAASLAFIEAFWERAERERWPVLFVFTHWEVEWNQRSQPGSLDGIPGMQAHVGESRFVTRRLGTVPDADLAAYVRYTLPGLTNEQVALLVEVAGGNFATMVENVGDLLDDDAYFVDRDVRGPLSGPAMQAVREFETKRAARVRQRFQKLDAHCKDLLSWSAQLGPRFLGRHLVQFAQTRATFQADAKRAIDQCVNPLVVLNRLSRDLHEFRDSAYFHEARNRLAVLEEDVREIQVFFSTALREWADLCFDPIRVRAALHEEQEGEDGAEMIDAGALDRAMLFAPSYELSDEDVARLSPAAAQTYRAKCDARLAWSERAVLAQSVLATLRLCPDADYQQPAQRATLRAYVAAMNIFSEQRDWVHGRKCAQAFAPIDWATVAPHVVSMQERANLMSLCSWADAPDGVAALLPGLLAHYSQLVEGRIEPSTIYEASPSLRLLTLKQMLEQQARAARDRQDMREALAAMRQAVDVAEFLEYDKRAGIEQVQQLWPQDQNASRIIDVDDAMSGVRFELADAQYELARTLQSLALMQRDAGNHEEAMALLERSISLLEPLAADSSTFRAKDDARRDLARYKSRLGQVAAESGDLERAREQLQGSLAWFEQMHSDTESPDVDLLVGFGEVLCCIGWVEAGTGEIDTGLAYLERALKMARAGAQMHSGPRYWHAVYDVLQFYLSYMSPDEYPQKWCEVATRHMSEARRLNAQFETNEFTHYAETLQRVLAELDARGLSSCGA